ncbi:SDR family NAD(P)-dependent oxidoreductase [Hellea sp.]|mgnify:FL=1|nr:SDR family oxidoreductase [Hellea sp.]MDC1061593.1 SDR family NAD(P)-dependent oxidoreductase [Hellea sp.]MDG1522966.1 SDR family NAD(P)-dependent oxidoreductase [Hellea sp.]|tara:strand:+ start:525 stop:1253 length:729 start_codon:yes stop_codon:yes gene_type:complete
MITQEFSGKTVLITGASKGIGRSIALAFLERGAFVIAAARPSKELDDLSNILAERGEIWAEDVTTESFLGRIKGLNTLDFLINNTGINFPEALVNVSDEHLDKMLNLNVRSTFRISREGVKQMSSGGCVINVTSQMGHIGSPNRTAYCMTKHAIEGLTKAMAVELAPKNIRVNSVAPTFIKTDMTSEWLSDAKFVEFIRSMMPLGKIGQPEDVASAVIYLCSDGAKMVTGHSLIIDGGWTAQ